LLAAAERPHREKVTLEFDRVQVREFLGDGFDADSVNVYSSPKHRVEVAGELIGMTTTTAYLEPVGTMLALAVVDTSRSPIGTVVDVAWGHHPGPGTAPDAHRAFPRLQATVAPAPYDAHARERYRSN